MATEFNLSVVAPDRTVFDDKVVSVVAPGTEGYIGIQAGHQPEIAALKPGIIEYLDAKGKRTYVASSGGFMEVSGKSVIILAEEAQASDEITLEVETERLERARKALRGEDSSMTKDEATRELNSAIVRIKAARMR